MGQYADSECQLQNSRAFMFRCLILDPVQILRRLTKIIFRKQLTPHRTGMGCPSLRLQVGYFHLTQP